MNHVIQGAFVQGVSIRKMEKFIKSPGIENLPHGQTSEMAEKRAHRRVNELIETYARHLPKAVHCLEEGLEASPAFYAFLKPDARRSHTGAPEPEAPSPNQRGGELPNPRRLHQTAYNLSHLMEYAEDLSFSRAYLHEHSIRSPPRPAA